MPESYWLLFRRRHPMNVDHFHFFLPVKTRWPNRFVDAARAPRMLSDPMTPWPSVSACETLTVLSHFRYLFFRLLGVPVVLLRVPQIPRSQTWTATRCFATRRLFNAPSGQG